MRAFAGDPALTDSQLAALDERIEAASLAPLELTLYDAIGQARAGEAARDLARRVADEIPAQWKAQGRVDDDVHPHLRALETAVAAAAVDLANASVFGAFGCNVRPAWLRSDAMQRWLLARLAA